MSDYSAQLSEYINGWLNTFIANSTTPSRGQERDASLGPILNWNDMPTPPLSDLTQEIPRKSRRRSPKRPRQDDTQEESTSQDTPFDDNQTPTGPARTLRMTIPTRPFSNPPTLPPSSSTSRSSNHSRSTSPVKRATLELLQKPVTFIPIDELKIQENIQNAFNRIFDISYGNKFIPRAIEKEIRASGQRIISGWFFEHSDDRTAQYVEELAALLKIKDTARYLEKGGAHESAWNLDVHGPLLELALKPFKSLKRELLTQARISPPFIPEIKTGSFYDIISSKMIDFGVTVKPSTSTAQHISNILNTVPHNKHSINPIIYNLVKYDPIVVPIETKNATGHTEEARVQLGLWVAAWHKRMDALRIGDKQIVTLPLIMAVEHEWKLLFAYDADNAIDIAEGINMGGTMDLIGLYRVLGILRELAMWIETEYVAWLDRWLGLQQPAADAASTL
ncbi:exostosin 3 [Fusarium austroafricanum]|uniref:Exostosin 3 n=1 Tax=Fusarium austroafricanum TaxID=2364996 RepID=A0A8H4KM49_9HYPO|nr:exostosin 3 [Fusarium austroafricanum]